MTKAYFKTKQVGGGGWGKKEEGGKRKSKDSGSVRIKFYWSARKDMPLPSPPPPPAQLWQWALYSPPLYSIVDDDWSHSVFFSQLNSKWRLR